MVGGNDFGPTVTKRDNVICGVVMIPTVANRFQDSPLFVSDGGQVGRSIVSEILVQNELGDKYHLFGLDGVGGLLGGGSGGLHLD